jgi:hypothetical protein
MLPKATARRPERSVLARASRNSGRAKKARSEGGSVVDHHCPRQDLEERIEDPRPEEKNQTSHERALGAEAPNHETADGVEREGRGAGAGSVV